MSEAARLFSDPIPPEQLRHLIRHEPRRPASKDEFEAAADVCERLLTGGSDDDFA
jgi:hypothetical protein